MGSRIVRCQNNKINHIYTITFHHMKLRTEINKKAEADLKQMLDLDTLQALKKRLVDQKCRDTSYSKMLQNQTFDIRTPSTVDTTLRRRGNAIAKSVRPESKSKGKAKIVNSVRPSLNSQNAVTKCIRQNPQDAQQSTKLQNNESNAILSRKVLTDRAVYYGNVQLPYLHSSDAISCLYEKSKAADKNNQQPLINPPSNISPYLLTSLKNLYLYYTPLDSLRQLGTGWSNLKSLTVMCSYLLVDLSGLTIFPSLQYLFVPHNNIRQISDIMYHSNLRCVDLQDNKIDLIDQIEYLYTITNLQWVDVSHNPVTLVKEKYRIITENLGNKMQIEDCNRLFQYEMAEKDFDYQLSSYQNIEVSNNLIKQINEQILKEEIKVGEIWRAAQEKIQNGITQSPSTADVQIIQLFNYEDESEEDSASEDQSSVSQKKYERLQLRVTPLIDYAEPIVNVVPLKKYFHNKVCPQTKADKEKPQNSEINTDKAQSKQIIQEAKTKKFSATQKLTTAMSEQKKRLTSVSLKKRLSKLSLSKNNNFGSTVSSVLNNLKLKEEIGTDLSRTSPSNLKFLSKRRLISKISQEQVA